MKKWLNNWLFIDSNSWNANAFRTYKLGCCLFQFSLLLFHRSLNSYSLYFQEHNWRHISTSGSLKKSKSVHKKFLAHIRNSVWQLTIYKQYCFPSSSGYLSQIILSLIAMWSSMKITLRHQHCRLHCKLFVHLWKASKLLYYLW